MSLQSTLHHAPASEGHASTWLKLLPHLYCRQANLLLLLPVLPMQRVLLPPVWLPTCKASQSTSPGPVASQASITIFGFETTVVARTATIQAQNNVCSTPLKLRLILNQPPSKAPPKVFLFIGHCCHQSLLKPATSQRRRRRQLRQLKRMQVVPLRRTASLQRKHIPLSTRGAG